MTKAHTPHASVIAEPCHFPTGVPIATVKKTSPSREPPRLHELNTLIICSHCDEAKMTIKAIKRYAWMELRRFSHSLQPFS